MTQTNEDPGTTHVTVDGIEGSTARVELADGTLEDWPLASLPRGVKEGDMVRINVEGGDVDIEVDHAETQRRRTSAGADLKDVNANAPTGDINL